MRITDLESPLRKTNRPSINQLGVMHHQSSKTNQHIQQDKVDKDDDHVRAI